MHPAKLNENGSLHDVYKPAIYVDTNFLRLYYNAEGAEFCFDEDGNPLEPPWESELREFRESNGVTIPDLPPSHEELRRQMIWDLVGTKDNVRDFGRIRHFAINCLSKASLILTPIAVLELFKIHAEVTFKDICADSVGVKRIQRWGDRTVGEHLSDLFSRFLAEESNETLRELKQDCTFNLSFAQAHGLQGTFYVNDLRFRITDGDVGRFLWVLSFLQLEAADILHIHAAKLLGCDYLASLDAAFSKNKDIIEDRAGIKILSNAKQVIDVMKRNRKDDA